MKNRHFVAVMKTRWRENEDLLRRNKDRWRGIDWFGLLLLLATIRQDSKLCWCDIDSQTNVIAYAVILFVNQNHQLSWWYAPRLQGEITSRA